MANAVLAKLKKARSQALSEAQVLEALEIPDFRHMTKDKIMSFCSMVSEMDPEVAKAAISQFPEFSRTAREAWSDYLATVNGALDKSQEGVNRFYDICDRGSAALANLLERDDLAPEERLKAVEQMGNIARMASEKDSEHKRHVNGIVAAASGALGFVLCALIVAVGGRTEMISSGPSRDERR